MSELPGRRRARIDLNADVGEGYADAEVMPFVTSANVACGAHAGDAATMRATVLLARAHGVAVGAHPGFPDRAGFGRTITTRSPEEIERLVVEQVERLAAIAARQGVTLAHVKPHGALYNLAAVDDEVADAVARATARVLPGTRLFGLAGSRGLERARAAGLVAVAEAFADRAYLEDGTLAPRTLPGAVIEDPRRTAERAVRLACEGRIETLDGDELALEADTLCLHGDTPGAGATARAVHAALRDAGVQLVAPE
ncbi:MAG TPA: 5-oxoprolinase subunit PxpA [Candidatus Binatia bacterium]